MNQTLPSYPPDRVKKQTQRISYWITDKDESRSYADVERWNDRSGKGAIVEADLDLGEDIFHIPSGGWSRFEKDLLQREAWDRPAIFETEAFQVIVLPPSRLDAITHPRLVEVVS